MTSQPTRLTQRGRPFIGTRLMAVNLKSFIKLHIFYMILTSEVLACQCPGLLRSAILAGM